MTTAEKPEPVLESAPLQKPPKRDLLGNTCFYLHFAIMLYIVLGWLVPFKPLEVFYVVFLPIVVSQWQFNKNSCVLNNLETFIRTGSWRDPGNAEEGGWILTLAHNALGITATRFQMDVFIYSAMLILWLLGLGHLFHWAG